MAKQVFEPARVAVKAMVEEGTVAAALVDNLQQGLQADAYQVAIRALVEIVAPVDFQLGELRNVNADRRIFIEEAIRLGYPEAEASTPVPQPKPVVSDDLMASDDLMVGDD